MRTYAAAEACAFRFTRAEWGEFSNFCPLPRPIEAGPWLFPTSEHLYQAAKFAVSPNIQARIAAAPSARDAARIGRNRDLPVTPCWPRHRVNVMRWVIRRKLETVPDLLHPILERTADRPIVEVSRRDPFWGAAPVETPDGPAFRGSNALGRLWMELRLHMRDDDPRAASAHWVPPLPVGKLTRRP